MVAGHLDILCNQLVGDSRCINWAPELGIPPTGSLRHGLWRSSDLVDRQQPEEAGLGATFERGTVPQDLGADLGEEVLMTLWTTD